MTRAVKARRKRQTPGQRTAANRLAKQRQRQRDNFPAYVKEIVGFDVDAARQCLKDDPDLADRLEYEWRSLPAKQRGADPVTVLEGDQRHAQSGAYSEKSSKWIRGRLADLAAHGFSSVVDVEAEAERGRTREERFRERLQADMAGLEAEAAVMLAANRAMLEWKDTGKAAGGGRLTTHSSWLMFDGYNLGTLWPNNVKLITTVQDAKNML